MTLAFLDATRKLAKVDQKRLDQSLAKMLNETAGSGLRLHEVSGTEFVSLSPSMDLRVIAQRSGDELVLHHVDHHDAAYKWAASHQPVGGPVLEVVAISARPLGGSQSAKEGSTYGEGLAARLLMHRFPVAIVELLRTCTDVDDLLDRIGSMSAPWQDVILRVATGEELSAGDLPKPRDTVQPIRDDVSLSAALELPVRGWGLFLHPKQRAAVEDTETRLTAVVGGPGTGKSLVCLYRAQFLAEQLPDDQIVLVFTYGRELVSQLREQMAGIRTEDPRTKRVWILQCEPRPNLSRFVRISGSRVLFRSDRGELSVGAILVDEFQDCPREFMRFIECALEATDCQFVTLSLDPNQKLFSFERNGTAEHILSTAKVVPLSFSYRMTRPLMVNALGVLGQYALEFDDVLDVGIGIPHPVAAIDGPPPRYVEAPDLESVVRETQSELAGLVTRYPADAVAVVLAQYSSPHFRAKGRTDPVEAALAADAVIGPHYQFGFWVKGKEYFAGVVVVPANFFGRSDLAPREQVLRLNTLFVALTRFRNEVTIVYEKGAPAARFLPV